MDERLKQLHIWPEPELMPVDKILPELATQLECVARQAADTKSCYIDSGVAYFRQPFKTQLDDL